MSSCTFSDSGVRSGLKQKRALGRFVTELIAHYRNCPCAISYVFVSDEHLLAMNQQFLQHDTYTDIITFDLTEKNSELLMGDIYISTDRVRENAAGLKRPYPEELLRVILHGALHLSGFGDKTKKQREEMRALEDEWMKKYLALRAH